ncbi:hypothetical protein [Desulforhopalus sp. 52FAK]
MKLKVAKQKDERHRKIGRNLVLAQRLEGLLKALIFRANLTLTSNPQGNDFPSPEEQAKQQLELVKGKTLGNLGKKLNQSVLNLPAKYPSLECDSELLTVSLRLSYGTSEQQDRLKNKLELVRIERNKLVHELFISFDLSTTEGLADLDKFLERQHQSLLPLVAEFETVNNHFLDIAKQILARQADSKIPEDSYRLECATKLVVCLCLFEVDIKKTGRFEWISLAAAKKYLNIDFPEAIPECRRHYNVKSLKKILRKVGVFDVQRFPTVQEKEMVFYRMKHQYSIETDEEGEVYLCRKDPTNSGGTCEEKVSLGMTVKK